LIACVKVTAAGEPTDPPVENEKFGVLAALNVANVVDTALAETPITEIARAALASFKNVFIFCSTF
jgi:hypothetical protein